MTPKKKRRKKKMKIMKKIDIPADSNKKSIKHALAARGLFLLLV